MAHVDRLTCEELFQRLDDYLDRELNADEMRMVKEHLETCAVCTAEYTFEESVLRNVRAKLMRIQAPQDLLGKISRMIEGEKRKGG